MSSASPALDTPGSTSQPLRVPILGGGLDLTAIAASQEGWAQSASAYPREWYRYTHRLISFASGAVEAIEEKNRQYNFLETEVNNLRAQLQASNDELIAARGMISVFRQQSQEYQNHTSNREPRSEKLPDIPKFSGNKDELRSWTTQLHLKLFVNADRFMGPKSGLIYAISRLEGLAISQVQPYVRSEQEILLDDVASLLTMLERAFGDPDKKATAQRELRSLRQKNREFHVYLSDFQRLIPDTNFDSEAQRSALLNGVSDELKQLMVTQELPSDLDGLITLLQRLDTRQRNVNASLRKPFSSRSSSPATVGALPRNPQSGGVALPRAASPVPLSSSSAPEPMDLSTTSRGKLPSAEVTRRMTEGLCRYCGESGHFALNCPRLTKGPSRPKNSRLNETSFASPENAESSG